MISDHTMFCAKCGRGAVDGQAFCRFCGAQLESSAPVSQPRAKRHPVRHALVAVGVVLGLAVLIILSNPSTPENDTATNTAVPRVPQSAPAPSPTVEGPSDKQPTTFAMGQQFSIGYWSYLCNSAYWTPYLGYDPETLERANAEFLVVNITARNDDTSASTLPPFHLMDAEGRTYDESSAGALSQGFFSGLEQLNPGVSERGNVVFDVLPDRRYVLVVSGGIESGKQAIVVLPEHTSSNDVQTGPGVSP